MSVRSSSTSRTSSRNLQCSSNEKDGRLYNQHNNELNHFKGKVSSDRLNSYKVAFYGNHAEKEAYKQQIRTKLQDQVKEKDELHRKQLVDRVAESDNAVALDMRTKQEDSENDQKKAAYLKQFSNENKKIMEEKERNSRRTRQIETEQERHLLDVNPINWNMTLH